MRKLKLAVAATLVAGLGVFAPNAFGGFVAPVQYGVGTNPQEVVTGDLNGDGFSDLVASNYSNNNVSVLINDGDGTFAAKVDYPAGADPDSVTMGDVNADSFPDLAVPNINSATVSILLNDGDGTFGAPQPYGTGVNPTTVAIGKFGSDNFADLAVTNKGDDNVSVLAGTGTGTFGTKLDYSAGQGPGGIATGDLNDDGWLDLAVSLNDGDSVAILMANPISGYFGLPVTYVAAQSPSDVTLGDFDGDGILDMAVSDLGGNYVSVFIGVGDGTFATPPTNNPVAVTPIAVATGDLTGDGILDIVTANVGAANLGGNTVSVLAGVGDGTFAAAVSYPAGASPYSVAIGNLDDDDNPDLAVAARNDSAVSVLINDAPNAVASPSTLAFPGQAVGTTTEQTVTVTNESGGGAMTVHSISIAGSDPPEFSLVSNTCMDSSTPLSGTCEVAISFTPSAVGARDGTLFLSYNSADSPLEIPLTGTGTDVTPPDTVIDSGPSGTIDTDSATFTFSGSPASDTAKIMCQLDSAAFTDCSSPKTFSGLANGPHTVSFRAQDAAGNQDPTPASRSFMVEKVTPPVLVAKIGKVTVKGPKKVKRGRKATFNVKVTNSGSATATGVKVKVTGKGVKATGSAGAISAGQSKVIKVKIKAKKTGKVTATFKVTSSNAGSKTVKKKVTVRK